MGMESQVETEAIGRELTERQLQILQFLLKKAQPLRVYTVYADQDQIARELGMTRQALSVHLKKLKDFGLIRTGREFVDVTEKALRVLRMSGAEAIVMAKVRLSIGNRSTISLRSYP
jgi:transcriptional regulator, AsnC family